MTIMTKAELRGELLKILPYGTKLDNQTMDNMSQFIDQYLKSQRNAMIERYPHNREKIMEAYDFILFDNKNEIWLED